MTKSVQRTISIRLPIELIEMVNQSGKKNQQLTQSESIRYLLVMALKAEGYTFRSKTTE
jgi:hypothetical protein